MTFKHEQRIPPVLWAVVADRSRARVLSARWPEGDSWEEVRDLVHAEGSLTPQEAHADGSGVFSEQGGGGRHAGDDKTDYRHLTAERFAGEIVDLLQKAHSENRYGKLALVAPPLFIGVLRKKLPAPLASMVVLEIDKDYTHTKLNEVTAHLEERLAEATAD